MNNSDIYEVDLYNLFQLFKFRIIPLNPVDEDAVRNSTRKYRVQPWLVQAAINYTKENSDMPTMDSLRSFFSADAIDALKKAQ